MLHGIRILERAVRRMVKYLRRRGLFEEQDADDTAEGAELYFAWSLYLPQPLPSGINQLIGYWESKNSYVGAMTFEAKGEHLLFTTRNPYTQQWQADVLTAGTWHRIAMHVLWSTDPNKGVVDVWFDGQQVVTHAVTKTKKRRQLAIRPVRSVAR